MKLMDSGVYQIKNLINGKCYIGSAVDIKRREAHHLSRLQNNKHYNQHLQHSWNKYGKENFILKILLYCDKKNCILFEQRAMDILNSEYNIAPIASSSLGCKHKRKKLSDKHKAKISRALMGNTNGLKNKVCPVYVTL